MPYIEVKIEIDMNNNGLLVNYVMCQELTT